jgi:uncharacterized lipoprotein YajG
MVGWNACRYALCAAALAVAACGDRDTRISLAPMPAPAVGIVAGADRVALDVVKQDKRAQFQDRVGTFRGEGLRKIVTDTDVADYVRSGLARGLAAEGFVLAPNGLVLTVELQNFYCDYTTNGTGARVAFTLRARTPAGRTLYSKYYDASGVGGGSIFDPGERARTALEQATANAVKQALDDKALQAALFGAGRS